MAPAPSPARAVPLARAHRVVPHGGLASSLWVMPRAVTPFAFVMLFAQIGSIGLMAAVLLMFACACKEGDRAAARLLEEEKQRLRDREDAEAPEQI